LGEAALSPALQRLILERSQGNPLFVGEVALALREAGAIRLQPDALGQPAWDLPGGDAPVDVPTTLTGLIMSRIDRLETAPRQVIQVASVIGVNFRATVLERVYPYDDLGSGLQPRLQELVRVDMTIFEPPEQYAFKHNLTQEVAYGSLSFARRRELHVRVGEELEQRSSASSLAEQYGVLAHHFFEGRVYARAFDYLVKAGDKARAEFANEAALSHYRRALEIAANPKIAPPEAVERQGSILEAMGDVNLLTSEYDSAIQQFRQALEQPGCTARRRPTCCARSPALTSSKPSTSRRWRAWKRAARRCWPIPPGRTAQRWRASTTCWAGSSTAARRWKRPSRPASRAWPS
jgi:hypothetical protein